MAKTPRPTRPMQPERFDDEIDLMELVHFIVKGARWWISGGLIAGLLALLYALTLFPITYRQQTINDIGLNQERLALINQMIPPMTVPLKENMRAQKLESLYNRITKSDDFLNKTIFGLSGVDLKNKGLDLETKGKIDSVRILVKGKNPDQMQREMSFIHNSIRGLSQYLSVKRFLDDESREAKLKLFNTEAQVNGQQLNFERAERQLLAYQELQRQSNQQQDLQIILNLSNQEERLGDKGSMNSITEFTGAKYLPLGNRIVGLKSEMADQLQAIRISQQQIEALKLSQSVLSQMADVFASIVYQADVIDFQPLFEVVQEYRQRGGSAYSREEIAALDNLERNLISFERNGLKFNNTLPTVLEQKGRGKLVVISGLLGGVFGFLWYVGQTVMASYRRRYLK